ncbi:MAG: RnfABCDGE type electron transport complex subunit B [Chloroflexota bacterium]|jgi:RnfABCDGE-type electron transport complex B subunit
MDTTLIVSLATMGGLGFLFSVVLAVANKKLNVAEDKLVSQVIEILPNVNCGACGIASCQDFAVKVVAGSIAVNSCPIGGVPVANELAHLLGVRAIAGERKVARLMCQGGNGIAVRKNVTFRSAETCAAMALLSGGDKACYFGCLGDGDCVAVCPSNAIFMGANGLPIVIEALCSGCGLCAKACPRGVLEIHPLDRAMFVFCKNLDGPRSAKSVCAAACLGCGICARLSEGSIRIENNLAVIDYDQLREEIIPISQCKTKAIGVLKPRSQRVEKDDEVKVAA